MKRLMHTLILKLETRNSLQPHLAHRPLLDSRLAFQSNLTPPHIRLLHQLFLIPLNLLQVSVVISQPGPICLFCRITQYFIHGNIVNGPRCSIRRLFSVRNRNQFQRHVLEFSLGHVILLIVREQEPSLPTLPSTGRPSQPMNILGSIRQSHLKHKCDIGVIHPSCSNIRAEHDGILLFSECIGRALPLLLRFTGVDLEDIVARPVGYRIEHLRHESRETRRGKEDDDLVRQGVGLPLHNGEKFPNQIFLRGYHELLLDVLMSLFRLLSDGIHKMVIGTQGNVGNLRY
mmetsp:Transcript_18492/g.33995  ORF Transcript_18492/g.33995 Transcript_18492/m.33995 type:complete len:288 (+) Transcript_18492:78-941(+)